MKIIYFHGSGGGSIAELTKYFNKKGIDLVSPEISYYDYIDNPHLFPAIEHMASDADLIIGYSMGGWFAYHLGIKLNKDILLFNPAISDATQSCKLFKNISPDISGLKLDKTIRVLLSDSDEVVNHNLTKKKLTSTDCGDIRISNLVGEKHNIDFKLMVGEILDFCSTLEEK